MLKKDTLQRLYYDKRLSMVDIAGAISVTPATVKYWMDRHKLNRRSISESAYVKQNPKGDPFKIKNHLNNKDRELLLCGLMLYWAEGSRRNKHTIQMANLDHRLISLFIQFLKKICRVEEEKICLNIQLYRTFDKTKTKQYWSRILGIPQKFISVNTHTDVRSKPTKQWSKYGIARVEVRNVKLKRWIDNELATYLSLWE